MSPASRSISCWSVIGQKSFIAGFDHFSREGLHFEGRLSCLGLGWTISCGARGFIFLPGIRGRRRLAIRQLEQPGCQSGRSRRYGLRIRILRGGGRPPTEGYRCAMLGEHFAGQHEHPN